MEREVLTCKLVLIEGTKDKYICDNGHVYDKNGNRIDKDNEVNEQGYLVIDLHNKGNYCSIQKLVAKHILYKKWNEYETKGIPFNVHHKDSNKKNNRADNLEILTVEEHRQRHIEKEEESSLATLPKEVLTIGLTKQATILLGFINKCTKTKDYKVKGVIISEKGYNNFLRNRVSLSKEEVYKAIEELKDKELVKGSLCKGDYLYKSVL